MGQRQQSLLEAAQLPPACAKFTPSGVDEPGDMLDQLVRDIEHGRIRNQRSSPAVGVLSEITTPTTRGFATSPHLTSLFHSSDPRMKEAHSALSALPLQSEDGRGD